MSRSVGCASWHIFCESMKSYTNIREKMSRDEVYTLQESTWCPLPPPASCWGRVFPSQEPAPQQQFSFTGTEFNYWFEDTGKKRCHEIFCFRFFSWVSFPYASELFRKTAEIFAKQGAPPVSTTPAANFATGTAGVVDTCRKFATGVNDTGGTVPLRVTRPLSLYNNTKGVWFAYVSHLTSEEGCFFESRYYLPLCLSV